jgi:hypothetical protein
LAIWLKRVIVGVGVAWLILAGAVIGWHAGDALPTAYLWRPLAIGTVLALPIGGLAALAGRWVAVAAAIGAVALVSLAVAAALAVPVAITLLAGRRDRRQPMAALWARAALILSSVFFLLAVAHSVPNVDAAGQPAARGAGQGPSHGPSVYLVLLDGYPRGDTLIEDLGIDNGPFLDGLSQRGFDVYDDARSARDETRLTLLALLNGTDADVPAETGSIEGRRVARRALDVARLPLIAMNAGYDYVVIDSPIGHVTFGTGTHIGNDGLNDFEERLLAETSAGRLVSAATPYLMTDSLRARLDASMGTLVGLSEPGERRLVLAHLLAPHLPFLYAADGSGLPVPPYWPRHPLFGNAIEDLDITLDYYRTQFAGNLRVVNDKILVMVDAMTARDPDAVIVLFSDHGARYSYAVPDEWSHSFLAARTPNHARLFGKSPTTTHLLCDIFVTYLALPCR